MCNKVSFDSKQQAKKEIKEIKYQDRIHSRRYAKNKGAGRGKKLRPY